MFIFANNRKTSVDHNNVSRYVCPHPSSSHLSIKSVRCHITRLVVQNSRVHSRRGQTIRGNMLRLILLALVSTNIVAELVCPLWGYSRFMSAEKRRPQFISRRNSKYRIWNGENAIEGAWPWMASLQILVDGEFVHACGATLVRDQWVLTAAHCLPETLKDPSNFRVVLGEHDRTKESGDEQTFEVETYVLYPRARSLGVAGKDLAAVRLKKKVQITERIKPILLPRENIAVSRESSDECYVLGWGKTQTGQPANVLQQLEVMLRTGPECYEIHLKETLIESRWNRDKLSCPELLEEEQGACQGDSGGPLICRTKNKQFVRHCGRQTILAADADKRCANLPPVCETDPSQCDSLSEGSCEKVWRLISIVSKGVNCGHKPGVYPKIHRYLRWLRKVALSNNMSF